MDRPLQKKFGTAFIKPLKPGQKRRYYLEYEVEEPDRYFENKFLTSCKDFVVTFDFPGEHIHKIPVASEIDADTGGKVGTPIHPERVEEVKGRKKAVWTKR